MDQIVYKDNTLNHHNKSILHKVAEGILINDKMYRIEEFRIKDDGLYCVVTDEHKHYEVQLSGNGVGEQFDDTYLKEMIDQTRRSLEDKISSNKELIDRDVQELRNLSSVKSTEYLELVGKIDSLKLDEISVEQLNDTLDVVPVSEDNKKIFKIGISQRIKNVISSIENTIYQIKLEFSKFYTKEESDSVYLKESDLQPLSDRISVVEQRSDNDTVYDDTDVVNRLIELENREDKDTVYDDTDIKERLQQLESKPTYKGSSNILVNNSNGVISLNGGALMGLTDVTDGKLLTFSNNKRITVRDSSDVYTKEEVDNKFYTISQANSTLGNLSGFNKYYAIPESISTLTTNVDKYKTLSHNVVSSMGILHLDFSVNTTTNATPVFRLPSGAPRPKALIETAGYYGTTLYTLWIEQGGDTVYALNLPRGRRVIIDLIGFWE